MKKNLKIILITVIVLISIVLLDTLQALIFENNPIIKIKEYYNGGDLNYKSKGILVDTYNCTNGEKDTQLKGFSYSCNYMGGNYTLVDKTKDIKDFMCAEALEEFYEDTNYTYYWDCIKNKYMIVKYDDGTEETISQALLNGHIDIQILDKFNISYYKEEKGITLENLNTIIQEYFGKEDVDRTNLGYNYIDEEKNVVVVGLIDNSQEKQDEFIYNVFSNCCGSMYIEYVKDNSMIKFEKTDSITASNHN